jgi:hypothetical protein
VTTPRTRTLHEATADLGLGRCLRFRLIRDPDGEPAELWISEGWAAGGDDRRRMLGPLPGQALGEILDALRSLETEVEG